MKTFLLILITVLSAAAAGVFVARRLMFNIKKTGGPPPAPRPTGTPLPDDDER